MSKTTVLTLNRRSRKRLQLHFPNDGRTQQHFKEETDINNIMTKFAKTGELPTHVNRIQGAYGDFSSVQDYQLHLDQVIAANEAFMALPAALRRRFDNDPSHLVSFLADENNRDEAIALGLVEPTPAPQPKDAPGASSGASGGGDPSADTPKA